MSVAQRFANLKELKGAHRALNRSYREAGADRDMESEIRAFVEQGRATGAVLFTEDERQDAQYLLDYWAAQLYSAESEVLDTTLEGYDETKVHKLSDDQYPFPTTKTFVEGEFETFFDRGGTLDAALEILRTKRLLVVTGKFDSGAHSFVNGRLLPALEEGAKDWNVRFIRPGEAPLLQLEKLHDHGDAPSFAQDSDHLVELLSSGSKTPTLLVVFQLEDVYWLCRNKVSQQAFIANLIELVRAPGSEHAIVMTLDDSVRLPEELAAEFRGVILHLDTPSTKSLYQAVRSVGEASGIRYEEGVVDSLIRDVAVETDAFALLGLALQQLWKRREGNRITVDAYRSLGEIHKLYARQADAVFAEFSDEEYRVAKDFLLWLVELNRQLEPASSPEAVSALLRNIEHDGKLEREVLGRLVSEGLLRRYPADDEESARVEIAHHSLLQHWPPLQEWIEQDEDFRAKLELSAAAEAWQEAGREPGRLLTGALLEKARAYDINEFDDLEHEFIDASIELQQELQNRAYRRLSYILVGVMLLALVAVLGWGTAWNRGKDLEVTAWSLKAQLQKDDRVDLALSSALWANAIRNAEVAEAQKALSDVLQAVPHKDGYVAERLGYGDAPICSERCTVQCSERTRAELGFGGREASSCRATEEGSEFLVVYSDASKILWRREAARSVGLGVQTLDPLPTLTAYGGPGGRVDAVFSADSRLVGVWTTGDEQEGVSEVTWRTPEDVGDDNPSCAVGDVEQETPLTDLAEQRGGFKELKLAVDRGGDRGRGRLAVQQSNKTLALFGLDGTSLDPPNFDENVAGGDDTPSRVTNFSFDPGGSLYVLITPPGRDAESKLRRWNDARGLHDVSLSGSRGKIESVVLGGEGLLAVGASLDGETRITVWTLDDGSKATRLSKTVEIVASVTARTPWALDCTGTQLAIYRTAEGKKRIELWDTRRGQLFGELQVDEGGAVIALAYAGSGRLQSVDERGRLTSWDVDPRSWWDRGCSLLRREDQAGEEPEPCRSGR